MAYRPTPPTYEVPDDDASGVVVTAGNLLGVIQAALEQGELELASRLYEESGRPVADQLLAALQKRPQPIREKAAQMYVMARDFARAARLHESAKSWPDAARMYEEAADLAAAARCHLWSGETRRAAECLDSVGQLDEAAKLYEKLGEREAQADCLLRGGQVAQAAQIYRALGNTRAEMDALGRVSDDDPAKPPAVRRLAQILVQRNRITEATQVCADALRVSVPAKQDQELHRLLISLFEKQGLKIEAQRTQLRLDRLARRTIDTIPDGVMSITGTMQFNSTGEALSTLITTASKLPVPPADPAEELAAQPKESYGFLKAIPLFARLTLDDMRDLHRLGSEVNFNPGTMLIEAGVDAPGLLVIIEGTAEVLAMGDDGPPRYLNSLGPGDHLGEISMLCNSLTSARVVASTWLRSLAIPRQQFERYLVTHPGAALRIYRLFAEGLAGRVRALSQ